MAGSRQGHHLGRQATHASPDELSIAWEKGGWIPAPGLPAQSVQFKAQPPQSLPAAARTSRKVPIRRGSQPSPWVGPGKPNLPLGLRGKAGGCARVTAGPKRPHLGVCPHFSHVQLFVTPWTVACQAPLSMGISRPENWSGPSRDSRSRTRSPSPRAWRPDFPGPYQLHSIPEFSEAQ